MSDPIRNSIAASPHLRLMVSIMEQRGIRFVHVDSTTDHGIPWAAIVVQGEPDVTVLRNVARQIAEALEADRQATRDASANG